MKDSCWELETPLGEDLLERLSWQAEMRLGLVQQRSWAQTQYRGERLVLPPRSLLVPEQLQAPLRELVLYSTARVLVLVLVLVCEGTAAASCLLRSREGETGTGREPSDW